MPDKKSPSSMNLAAILSISFVMMAFMATMPAMAALGVQFGAEYGTNLSLLSNGYVFTVVPVTILGGWLTNNGKLKYRTATFLGSLLMLVGGVLPAIVPGGFWYLFVCKLVFGVGLGLLTPLYNALIMNLYEGNEQARYLGWTTLLMDLGGIIIQNVAGRLVDGFGAGADGAGWYMHYWCYAIAVIPLVMSLFIPEPAPQEAPAAAADEAPAAKESLGAYAIIAGIFLLLVNLLNTPANIYMTNVFIDRGIGGDTAASIAGTTLSCVAIAGVFSSALYEKIFNTFKRFTPVFAFALMAFGAFLLRIAPSAVVAMCGTTSFGLGFSLIIPACMTIVGVRTPPSRVTLGTSVAMALMNLGGLIATPYINVLTGMFGDGTSFYNSIFTVEAAGFVICALIFVLWNPYPEWLFGTPSE
ncbi:MAG: MFS transporter [Atopobiaceae bacterium]|nr:MFS transporter [Atopobiaceae bacterium]